MSNYYEYYNDDSKVYYDQVSFENIISGTLYEDYLNNLDLELQNIQSSLVNNQTIDITQLYTIEQSFEQVEDYYEYNYAIDLDDHDDYDDYYEYNNGIDLDDISINETIISSNNIENINQLNNDSKRTEVEDFVERFYSNVLERESDEAGLNNWTDNLLSSNITAHSLATGFFTSQEFINNNTSNDEFVDILYKTLLNRQADTEGKNNWVNSLENGYDRDEVRDGFVYSEEFNILASSYNIEIA